MCYVVISVSNERAFYSPYRCGKLMNCDETRLMALGGQPRLRGTLFGPNQLIGYEIAGKKANSEKLRS